MKRCKNLKDSDSKRILYFSFFKIEETSWIDVRSFILWPLIEPQERQPWSLDPFAPSHRMGSIGMPRYRPRENLRFPSVRGAFVCAERRRWLTEDPATKPIRTRNSYHREPRHFCRRCSKGGCRRWGRGRSRWSSRKDRFATQPFWIKWGLQSTRREKNEAFWCSCTAKCDCRATERTQESRLCSKRE